jgi:peptidoglycan/LPS O-acetylase OafA/YrhL
MSSIRRHTARTIRGAAEVIRLAALLAALVVVLFSVDTANGPQFNVPLSGVLVLVLAAVGVERLGVLLRDLGDHIERPL